MQLAQDVYSVVSLTGLPHTALKLFFASHFPLLHEYDFK